MGRRRNALKDALLGRTFSISQFKALVNLSISRLAVLKNRHQVLCTQARSDVAQLLNHAHQERALLRVEQVIKEQNMLDVFVMLEGYCNLLIERVFLIENNRVCPDELKEAISSLIFAASRCGQFPELQKIRGVFTSRFGKEFTAQSVELRNNCGVNHKMIQKLSTRQPSLENRLKVLKEIASENGVTLHLEEESSVITEEKLDLNQKQNQPEPNPSPNFDDAKLGDDTHNLTEEKDQNEQFCGSMKTMKKYRDVASAAKDAFESAAYAAAAARAAVELSQSLSQDKDPDDDSPTPRRRNRSDDDGYSGSRLETHVGSAASEEVEHLTGGLDFKKIHPIDNSSSESEGEELPQNHGKIYPEEFNDRKNKEELGRSLSASSSDSDGDTLKDTKMSGNVLGQTKPFEEIVFDQSDDETGNEQGRITGLKNSGLGVDGKSTNEFSKTKRSNAITDSAEQVRLQRSDRERRPISVRTRRGNWQ